MVDWKKEIRFSDLFKRDKSEKRAAGGRDKVDWKPPPATPPGSPTPTAGEGTPPASPAPGQPDFAQPAPPPPHEPASPVPDAGTPPPPGPGPTPASPPPETGPAPASQPPGTDPAPESPHGAPPHDVPVPPSPGPAPTAGPPAQGPPADPAAGQHPQGPVAQPESAPQPEGQETSVWKKEVRATDLLKKMGWSAGGGPKAPRGARATAQRTPRPDGPREDAPDDAREGSVWKRELKAGDLFRRREKAPSVPGDAFTEAGAEPVSFWKKEISLTDLLRKGGSDTQPRPPSAPGASQPSKRGKLSLPSLGGGLFGSSGAGRASPNAPVAIPLTRAVNLLPPDLASQKKKAVGPAEIGVAVAGLVVVIGLAILFNSASSRVNDAEQQLAALEAERSDLADAAAALEAQGGLGGPVNPLVGEEGQRASALSNALESRTAWDRVLRRITVVMPGDTWLRGLGGTSTTSDLTLNTGPGAELVSTLTLTGYSMSRDGVAKLLSRLETIPELATVQLLAATQTELADTTVIEYSITATLADDGSGAARAATTIGVTP